MAEEKRSARKASNPQENNVAAEAETSTSPIQTVTQEPTKEVRATGENVDTDVDADDYNKSELQEEARQRGLDDSGSKTELAERINEHDEQGVHKPEVLYPTESE